MSGFSCWREWGVKRGMLCVWKGFSFSWAKDVINVSVCGGGWWWVVVGGWRDGVGVVSCV